MYGSYVHGIFDLQKTADALVSSLAEMKGIDPARVGKATGKEYKDQQYDLLADTVRAHMDMKKIYEIAQDNKVELLKYNEFAGVKYKMLGMKYPLE